MSAILLFMAVLDGDAVLSRPIAIETDFVNHITFGESGKHLLFTGREREKRDGGGFLVSVYDVDNRRVMRRIPTTEDHNIERLVSHPSRSVFAILTFDGEIDVFGLNGKRLARLRQFENSRNDTHWIGFSGDHLYGVSGAGVLTFWSVDEGAIPKYVRMPTLQGLAIGSCITRPDGVVAWIDRDCLMTWNINTQAAAQRIKVPLHSNSSLSGYLISGQTRFLCTSIQGDLFLYDLKGRLIRRVAPFVGELEGEVVGEYCHKSDACIVAKGKRFVVVDADGNIIARHSVPDGVVGSLSMSRDCSRLAIGANLAKGAQNGRIYVYDIRQFLLRLR